MHRILIVDDESTLRETMAAILSRDDYAVDTAAEGAEALRLLDLHTMPAVVFMTGQVGDSIDGALPPGALVLEKPFSLNTLCETVEQLLATRWGESGERAHGIPR